MFKPDPLLILTLSCVVSFFVLMAIAFITSPTGLIFALSQG